MPKLPNKSLITETFDECVTTLFEELQLAAQWGRPSILLAVVSPGKTRSEAQKALESKLDAAGQFVHRFSVKAKHFDIARELMTFTNLNKSVFFVSNLAFGGGKSGANAYRALNIRREILVENHMRIVFWLSAKEAMALPQRAPDFWSFRHRVIEFRRLRSPNKSKG